MILIIHIKKELKLERNEENKRDRGEGDTETKVRISEIEN